MTTQTIASLAVMPRECGASSIPEMSPIKKSMSLKYWFADQVGRRLRSSCLTGSADYCRFRPTGRRVHAKRRGRNRAAREILVRRLERAKNASNRSALSQFQITYVVDADHGFGVIMDRLVSGDVGFAENVDLAVKWFVLPDGLDSLACWIKHGSDRAGAVVLFHVGCDADKLVALLDEDRCRGAGLLRDLINQ